MIADHLHAAGDCTRDARVLATLMAAFAIKGHAVYGLADGGFLVVRPAWNGVRHCADLDALRGFARIVGAS